MVWAPEVPISNLHRVQVDQTFLLLPQQAPEFSDPTRHGSNSSNKTEITILTFASASLSCCSALFFISSKACCLASNSWICTCHKSILFLSITSHNITCFCFSRSSVSIVFCFCRARNSCSACFSSSYKRQTQDAMALPPSVLLDN